MSIQAINPSNDGLIKTYETLAGKETDQRLEQADNCFGQWRRRSFDERARLMKKAARMLEEKSEELATLITQEMGKPITAARGEIKKCAWVCDYYAEHARSFLQDEDIATDAQHSFISYQPLGAILAIMPWNFPFWQVFRFAAPALMAGNVAVLKHASNVPGCAMAIEAIFRDAGLPQGAFTTLLIDSNQVDAVIEDKRVAAVTLTGSGPAGRSVAAKAGACLKKSVLELGGNDPYIVLADADVEAAAKSCVASRLVNTGQSCIAAKRFIVVDDVHDAFVEQCLGLMSAARQADPLLEDTEIGPMARGDLRDELHQQVLDSISAGADCLLGGKVPNRPGAWYPATVLVNVTPGMPAYDDELFGPVAAVIRARDTEDAIRIANNSPYGLGGAVFTSNLQEGERIAAQEIESGAVAINDFVKSDPRMPFGGIKQSGYGRELSSFGIREFVNIKSVVRS